MSDRDLEAAIRRNDADAVEKLLREVNPRGTRGDMFFLHEAAAHGNLKIVRMLLSRDVEVDRRSNRGETPLMMAVDSRTGDPEGTAKALLDAGADPNARGEEKRTPLHQVLYDLGNVPTFWQLLPIVRTLVEAGADVNAVDAKGQTPLHVAATHIGSTRPKDQGIAQAIFTLLVENGAKLDARDDSGRTPREMRPRYSDQAEPPFQTKLFNKLEALAATQDPYGLSAGLAAMHLGPAVGANAAAASSSSAAEKAPDADGDEAMRRGGRRRKTARKTRRHRKTLRRRK